MIHVKFAPYGSLPGPLGPESRKSLQRVFRGLPAPGSKKCPRQSKNSPRSLETVYFETPETVFRLFRTLFGPWGRKAPGDSLETLSGFRAQRARETPVRGGRGCKSMINLEDVSNHMFLSHASQDPCFLSFSFR